MTQVVRVIFVIMATAFIADTAVLAVEFSGIFRSGESAGQQENLSTLLASFYGHNYIYFPTLGLLALAMFYRPTVMVFDWYYNAGAVSRNVIVGFLSAMLLSAIAAAVVLSLGEQRALFEIKPSILQSAQPVNKTCLIYNDRATAATAQGASPSDAFVREIDCSLLPPKDVLRLLKLEIRDSDRSFADMTVSCRQPSPISLALLNDARSQLEGDTQRATADVMTLTPSGERKYCFLTNSVTDQLSCCASKGLFQAQINELATQHRSVSFYVQKMALPIKAMYLVFFLGVGLLLAARTQLMSEQMKDEMPFVEIRMAIGSLLLLVWPVVNYTFTKQYDVLFGGFDVVDSTPIQFNDELRLVDTRDRSTYRQAAPLYISIVLIWVLALFASIIRKYETIYRDIIGAALLTGGAALVTFNLERLSAIVADAVGIGANSVSIITLIFVMGAVYFGFARLRHERKQRHDDASAP